MIRKHENENEATPLAINTAEEEEEKAGMNGCTLQTPARRNETIDDTSVGGQQKGWRSAAFTTFHERYKLSKYATCSLVGTFLHLHVSFATPFLFALLDT
jgi:hypothetical protein